MYLILGQASVHLASYFRAVHLTLHPSICVPELFSSRLFDFSSGVSLCSKLFSSCLFNSPSGVSQCGKLFSSCSFNSPSGVRPCGEFFSSRSFNFNSPSGVSSFGELFSSSSFNFNSPSRNRPLASYFWVVHLIFRKCGELYCYLHWYNE